MLWAIALGWGRWGEAEEEEEEEEDGGGGGEVAFLRVNLS